MNVDNITRVEIIDKEGRVYTNLDENNLVSYSIQDDGRTLKIFINQKDNKEIKILYTDGGVIYSGSPGASTIGGTWAFCAVNKNDELVFEKSGFHKTEGMGTTNQHTEYLAILHALESMPNNWSGCIATDSLVSIIRFIKRKPGVNLPDEYLNRCNNVLDRLGKIEFLHIKAHPTKKQLIDGMANGRPVSKWNIRCDFLCNKEKEGHY